MCTIILRIAGLRILLRNCRETQFSFSERAIYNYKISGDRGPATSLSKIDYVKMVQDAILLRAQHNYKDMSGFFHFLCKALYGYHLEWAPESYWERITYSTKNLKQMSINLKTCNIIVRHTKAITEPATCLSLNNINIVLRSTLPHTHIQTLIPPRLLTGTRLTRLWNSSRSWRITQNRINNGASPFQIIEIQDIITEILFKQLQTIRGPFEQVEW